ncbi:MAG: hypothetical protein V4750_02630 [Pseudomonadota bacterium]
MTDKETADLAYWERNMLALYYADGWYYDDVATDWAPGSHETAGTMGYGLLSHHPRYQGWRRVLSLRRGRITFHVPDSFDVGTLNEIPPAWDGHTTEEKWRYVAQTCGVGADFACPGCKTRPCRCVP